MHAYKSVAAAAVELKQIGVGRAPRPYCKYYPHRVIQIIFSLMPPVSFGREKASMLSRKSCSGGEEQAGKPHDTRVIMAWR
jgi:hypothetical protein